MSRKGNSHHLWLLLLALLLLAGMLLTLIFGRGSRHGYGALDNEGRQTSGQSLEHRVATQPPAPDPAVEIVDFGIAEPGQIARHL
ncbi:hypothetical protein EDC39_10787 [Geothermobacter ehrlichii]|uniref:Uncharacterized protein n=1 Tax=Geothermobacter ehrlichii TaxID=213224 RepID=A0A5D3WLY8_9BACT|nr:hypothetical protein EDC39_10787 [Geothermobacter ehrlichii]